MCALAVLLSENKLLHTLLTTRTAYEKEIIPFCFTMQIEINSMLAATEPIAYKSSNCCTKTVDHLERDDIIRGKLELRFDHTVRRIGSNSMERECTYVLPISGHLYRRVIN